MKWELRGLSIKAEMEAKLFLGNFVIKRDQVGTICHHNKLDDVRNWMISGPFDKTCAPHQELRSESLKVR